MSDAELPTPFVGSGAEPVPAVMPSAIFEETGPVKPKRRWKLAAIIAGILAAVVAIALISGTHYLRRPLARGGDNLHIPGLLAPVRVTTDELGVPRIFADHTSDLFRAQGYLDASERFFQMDYRRHVAKGTLSEFIGGTDLAINSDRVVRTMGWPAIASAEWDLLDQGTRDILEAYAAGVNAYLTSRSVEDISIEYGALQRESGPMTIRPWEPTDSLAWLKAVAWEMRNNFDEELDRTLAYAQLQNLDLVERLFPPFATAGNPPILQAGDLVNTPEVQLPTTGGPLEASMIDYLPVRGWVQEGSAIQALASTHTAITALPRLVTGSGASGSNSWVIAGRYTESGLPMVANDPHMALTVPSAFAQVGLFCNTVSETCPFNVAGFSLPGFPGVYVGHNGELAWGMTNLRADSTDLFVEQVSGDNSLLDDAWVPMEIREEFINVSGDLPPVPITIRAIQGRPVLSDIYDLSSAIDSPANAGTSGEFAATLAWSGLEPGRTAAGLLALNRATNSDEVAAAASQITAPNLAIVFGTTSGDIGFQAAGLIPVRSDLPVQIPEIIDEVEPAPYLPTDGTWPQDGRHSANGWQGWVPATQMPRALNPASGFIVAANQAVTDHGVGPDLGADFDYGFRAARIGKVLQELIDSHQKITVADNMALQFDDLSPAAVKVVPALRGIHFDSEWVTGGQQLLNDWDFSMDADSAAAAYFASAWNHILQLTFWDELPEAARPDGTSRWLVVLSQMLNNPQDPFWDDRSTLDVTESRDEILRMAMLDARNELTTRVSSNTADWHWGALHRLQLISPILGVSSQPQILQWIANPPAVLTSGSTLSVNSTAWPARLGEMGVMNGPAFRTVMDLGNLDGSTWVNVPGNSGHIRARHFADQLKTWNSGEQFPFRFHDTTGQSNFITFLPN